MLSSTVFLDTFYLFLTGLRVDVYKRQDPDNVIIFGQSGGGGKVTTLLQSPGADGLYAKGYSMSGVLDVERPTEEESGKALAESIMAELSLSLIHIFLPISWTSP